MPNWGNIMLTNAGKALEDAVKAKATNKTINYTKFKIGSGTLPSGGNWETRTDLVAPVMDVPITDAVAQSTGGTLVSAVATNMDLTVGFEMRELGLFATGTDGSEILYGVLVDSNPDYLSAKKGTTVTTVDFSLLVIVDSDLTVTATLSADSLIRRVDLDKHNTDPAAHGDKLVNLTTNGNSLRAVKGNGTNVDVVVPYAVGTTQAKPKELGNYRNNDKISVVRDLFNNELADMNKNNCSVRFIRLDAHLTTIYNNWAKNWDATMVPWGTIYGVMSLLSDDTYANVELIGWTGTTVLLQRIAGDWKTAERKVYTNGMLNVADTLKLQSNELTLDMAGGTQTNINIGLTPKNYSGSGFTYTFYNGKNSLADMVAKTQAVTDNSNNVATTAFVQSAVANLVSSAPATLDTLNELATALGDDPNFATTVSKNIGAIDAKANTNASNITALQTSDNAKFKAVSVSNDTLTFTKGDNTTTAVTVNNVANATNATNATYASRMRWNLGSFAGKTIADLRTALMSAATSIGDGNTGYVSFSAKLSNLVSGWETTTTTLTEGGGYCTVRISNVAISDKGYFHGTLYTYDAQEYTFSVIYGVWSALNRNLVQSDYDTLNRAITTTNTNLSSLSSTVTSHNTDSSAHIDIRNAIPRISILTGTCSDGETIPLPDGYTESQCKIFVSAMKQNPYGYWFDVNEGGTKNMLRFDCYTEGRIVRCAMLYDGFDSWRTSRDGGSIVNGPRIAGIANYLVIGIKYGG